MCWSGRGKPVGRLPLVRPRDDDENQIAVDRELLLDALAAGARDRLILELGAPTARFGIGAPTAPFGIGRPDDESTYSLLMPVRLDN